MKKFISILIAVTIIFSMVFVPSGTASANSGVTDFVTRLYNVCLDRQPDRAGLNAWSNQLINKQATGISAAYGFVFSNEFQSKKCSNEDYVRYMYNAFFGRQPDAAGFNAWVNALNNGTSRENVFCGFANSVEFGNLCDSYGIVRGYHIEGYDAGKVGQVNLFVERLYNEVLDRSCDNGGMQGWTTQLVTRANSGCEAAYGFVFSDEFINKHLCNAHYLDVLYRAFMGREADSNGKAAWKAQLDNGVTREEVFNGFAGSQEFIRICESYGIDSGSITIPSNGTHATGTCPICGTPAPSIPSNPGNAGSGNTHSGPVGYPDNTVPGSNTPTPTPTSGTHKLYPDIDVTNYDYEVIPFYENYNAYVLVKTNNPNPDSFTLKDESTVYASGTDTIFKATDRRFADVNYSDKTLGRFNGGYIFQMGNSDGGNLTVCEKYTYRTYYGDRYEYRPTSKTVTAPLLYSALDYIYSKCVNPANSFWDNMAAAQAYLNKYAVYPIGLRDENSPTSTPYLNLLPPYYADQYIMVNCNTHSSSSEGVLAVASYPMILDSMSFPGTMASIAKMINPNATVQRDSFYHYIVNVTYNGETKSYGGQGSHGDYGYGSQQGTATLFARHLTKFTSTNQYNVDSWFQLLYGYWNKAIEENATQYQKFNSSEIYKTTGIGGGWLRIAGGRYTYSIHGYYVNLTAAWVDGRYMDSKGIWIKGETLDKHPTADIIVPVVTFTNYQGKTLTQSVTYTYQSATDEWVSQSAYGSDGVNFNSYRVFPVSQVKQNAPELVLSRTQVEAMTLDRNTNSEPAHGYIYDGTAMPGTPF